MAKKSKNSKSTFPKWLKRTIVFLIFDAIIAAILLSIFLFSFNKPFFTPPTPTPEDGMLSGKLTWTMAGKNRKAKPGETVKMNFTPSEVNSMLRLSMNYDAYLGGKKKGLPQGQLPYSGEYLDGEVHFSYLVPVLGENFVSIVISGSFVTDYRDRNLKIDVKRLYLGRIKIPAGFANRKLAEHLQKAMDDNPGIQDYLDIFKQFSINPENKNLEVVYYPAKLREVAF